MHTENTGPLDIVRHGRQFVGREQAAPAQAFAEVCGGDTRQTLSPTGRLFLHARAEGNRQAARLHGVTPIAQVLI